VVAEDAEAVFVYEEPAKSRAVGVLTDVARNISGIDVLKSLL